MNVLIINAGSSSLKYQLIDMSDESLIAKGNAERIGIDGSNLEHKLADGTEVVIKEHMDTHTDAIKLMVAALLDENHGAIKSMEEITAVGHRVVHGGEAFKGSALIDSTVIDAIKANIPLAPLHNPANIMGIEACAEIMPNKPMVAVFDTAFHQTMPKKAYIYALPYSDYIEHGIRRYGFHGTSHKFVARKAAKWLEKPIEDMKIVTCHLGNGASVTAIDGGKSIDTSMGLTPLEGTPMGTRSGSVDPAIIPFLMDIKGMTAKEVTNYLNKESGVLGLSGISSDFRDLVEAELEGNERAKLALDVWGYSVKKYIGAYVAAMNGIDCLVLTAGIGENTMEARERTCNNLSFFGIELDNDKNYAGNGKFRVVTDISVDGSPVRILVVPTNEELMIARETVELI